jgi:hypothetical protein
MIVNLGLDRKLQVSDDAFESRGEFDNVDFDDMEFEADDFDPD